MSDLVENSEDRFSHDAAPRVNARNVCNPDNSLPHFVWCVCTYTYHASGTQNISRYCFMTVIFMLLFFGVFSVIFILVSGTGDWFRLCQFLVIA